ncbi:MAG: hypothetical protein LUC25_02275 [Ruminococcus sp.]|nr:hypothetical protein [Ruminococcus sp.]
MGLMFASLIFLLFDLNATSYEIDILPDLLGWVLLLIATVKLSGYIRNARYLKLIEAAMLVFSVFYEVRALLGETAGNIISYSYSLLKLVCITFALYCFTRLAGRMKERAYYNAAKKSWLALVVLEVLYLLLAAFIIPILPESIGLSITQVIVITLLFVQILFLIFLRKAQKSVDLK